MSVLPDDVTVLARRLADALDRAGIPYALGGAIAYAQWGMPRGTKDIDLNVFLDEPDWPRAIATLQEEGAEVDAAKATSRFRERGMYRGRFGGYPLDVFVPSIPFYESVKSRVVVRSLHDRPAIFLTAEDLSVFKFMFFRPKDIPDVQYMLAVQGAAFDRAYVRRWLVDMVGEQDERATRWDQLCREVPVP